MLCSLLHKIFAKNNNSFFNTAVLLFIHIVKLQKILFHLSDLLQHRHNITAFRADGSFDWHCKYKDMNSDNAADVVLPFSCAKWNWHKVRC